MVATITRNQKIVDMRQNGALIREICEDTGLCKNTILKILKNNGVASGRKSWCYNTCDLSEEELIEEVIKQYQDGKTMKLIAIDLGAKPETVRAILREEGLSPSGILIANGINTKEERTNRILSLRLDGYTYDAISDELGISKSIVYRTCKDSPVNRMLKSKQRGELEEKVMDLYNQGYPAKTIKDKLHKTYEEVRDILEKHGCSPGVKKTRIQLRNDRIYELYDSGMSVKDIAEEVNMNRYSVYHILEKRDKDNNSGCDAE